MISTGNTTGAPPIPAELLARMTPQQRAKFQAAMAASMARSRVPHVYNQCITEKSLQRGIKLQKSNNNGVRNCRQTIVSSSASVMEVHEECNGREKTSGTIHFEAVGPETVTGTIHMTMTEGAHTMTVNRTLQGKWIGGDCGSLKRADD